MLTRAQIEQYREDGYLVLDGIFPPAEVEALRAASEDPAVKRDLKARGGDEKIVHLLEIAAKHEAFRELARDPRITDLIAPLLGPDIQLQHSKLATKPPKKDAGAFGWHQDFAYFPHTNTNLLAVMVMLDDATPENGCMYVVRGSHKLGLLDHTRDGWFSGGCQESRYWSDPANLAAITPKAGGISIHHCLTLHASHNNRSGLPRRGVVFQYRADDAYQLADHVWADTGFQVRGTNRGVVRCEDRRLLLPKFQGRQNALGQPYGNVYLQDGERARDWNREAAAVLAGQ